MQEQIDCVHRCGYMKHDEVKLLVAYHHDVGGRATRQECVGEGAGRHRRFESQVVFHGTSRGSSRSKNILKAYERRSICTQSHRYREGRSHVLPE